jgi:alpha-beta hydrolase superfamily lysophospholipase
VSTTSELREVPRVQMRPVCLGTKPDPIFGFLHVAASGAGGSCAVLICPPFGWAEMCSHRALRTWAQTLAEAGFAAARIDLPGTGDSGGSPRDPGRLDAWTAGVSEACAWLREVSGARRIAVLGIGLGGLVAVRALSQGAAVDDLILWGVPARGRTMLRELRAYAGIVSARYAEDANGPPLPEGFIEVTGFLLSTQTARELEDLRLDSLPLPEAADRRVLLLGRGGLPVDKQLREHFEANRASVTVEDGADYDALMGHPQEGRSPLATIARTVSWLRDFPVAEPTEVADGANRRGRLERDAMDLCYGAVEIRETPISFDTGSGRRYGVLSSPKGPQAPICAVLLNAGAIRRIGPNRTWVEVARRWAALGVPTVRIDFEGIGDSDGDERRHVNTAGLYSADMTGETLGLLDELAALGLPNRFVLVGLCSGAYWALHASLAQERVVGAFLVNLYSFYWSEALVAERDRRETVEVIRNGMLRRVFRQGVSAQQLRRAVRGLRAGLRSRDGAGVEAAQASEVTLALDRLRGMGTQILFLLSQGEPLYDQFEREGRTRQLDKWPNVTLERIPSKDHNVRAVWLQQHVHRCLDRGLESVLGAMSETSRPRL